MNLDVFDGSNDNLGCEVIDIWVIKGKVEVVQNLNWRFQILCET